MATAVLNKTLSVNPVREYLNSKALVDLVNDIIHNYTFHDS